MCKCLSNSNLAHEALIQEKQASVQILLITKHPWGPATVRDSIVSTNKGDKTTLKHLIHLSVVYLQSW